MPEGMTQEDMYVENRQLDVTKVLAELEARAAQWKAAGRPIDCDIMVGLPYESNLNMQFMALQNKVATGGGVDSQGFGALAIMTEAAQGAGGGCKCDMSAAAPGGSHVLLLIGMAASSLAGIVAVRRRKK